MTDVVFISYSRKDKEFVQQLYAALKAHERDAWVDWQDILPSEKWWKAIEAGIEGAEAFVFVISPDSVESKVCADEIEHATKHNKRLVPIVRRDTEPERVHSALSAHNWLFMRDSDDFEKAIARLIEAVDTDLQYVRAHTRLTVRAVEWESAKRDNSFLLRGKDLADSERWLRKGQQKRPAPTPLQVEYITASGNVQHRKLELHNVFLISAAAAALLIGVSFVGGLQTLEFAAYDHLFRIRPGEPQDDRFLIVEVDEETSQLLDTEYGVSRTATLPDSVLAELLEKLQTYQPRVIGLDLYRPAAAQADLAPQLEQAENLVAICKHSETDWQGEVIAEGTKPPPEVSLDRVGFGDFLLEADGKRVRRQILDQSADPEFCNTETAFSLLVAQKYLESEAGIEEEAIASSDGNYVQAWQWGKATFKRIDQGSIYQFTYPSYITLLNYRAHAGDPANFAPRVSLSDILEDRLTEQDLQRFSDRIVLIGITDVTARDNDSWSTPYGVREVPGVIIQGQMTSHIISAVLDGRNTISWLPLWANLLWVLGWSVLGGLITWYFQRLLSLSLVAGVAIASLYILCSLLFIVQGLWLPLIPPALAFLLTGSSVGYITYRLRKAW
ncbi:MAG: CHASE2 domain-containing protein [Leptolyngbyaceae cyanobacterium SL_5_9]|nr:CHASE2 domain-containing protein [Leptolyngbyaceae cyanobacterium SL_5_9]NJO76390.1 CHASE2 domain-containing protein [Leptolyngbyaceae cyanobacterium RM1_406_9]